MSRHMNLFACNPKGSVAETPPSFFLQGGAVWFHLHAIGHPVISIMNQVRIYGASTPQRAIGCKIACTMRLGKVNRFANVGNKVTRGELYVNRWRLEYIHLSMYICMQAPGQYQRKRSGKLAEPLTATASPPQQHAGAKTTLRLPTALSLYGLTHSELLWELQLDTRCLMGWNDSTIVLAFRGTASITNAWSDLQVGAPCPYISAACRSKNVNVIESNACPHFRCLSITEETGLS